MSAVAHFAQADRDNEMIIGRERHWRHKHLSDPVRVRCTIIPLRVY